MRCRNCLISFALVACFGVPLHAADPHAGHHKVEKPVIFGWDNPTGVWFQLGQLDNAELLLVDRDGENKQYIPVWQAILIRPGMAPMLRRDAIAALVKLQGKDVPSVLVESIDKAAGEDNTEGVITQLTGIIARQKPAALAAHRDTFESLADSDAPAVRRAAYVGLITAGADAGELWDKAAASLAGPTPLLGALPLVADPGRRAAFADKVAPLVDENTEEPVLRAAMLALVSLPGAEAAAFNKLAVFVAKDIQRDAAVAAILRLPPGIWPKDTAAALAQTIITEAPKTPVAQRTEPGFADLITLGEQLAALLPDDQRAALLRVLGDVGVRIVRIRTVYEEMRYDTNHFAVEAAQPVQIVLDNPDAMPHNIVIVAPGALREIGEAADRMQPPRDPSVKAFIPDSPKVLHAGHLVQSNEVGRLSFVAPAEPGVYPFVCTFPGHWTKMFGAMVVVEDLDAFAAQPTWPTEVDGMPLKQLVDEWTIDKLRPFMTSYTTGRDFERGKRLFTEMGCAACHKVADQGGQVGPDLKETFPKYKGDREKVLQEILDPSATVDEKYQQHLLDTADGVLTGLIVKRDDKHIWLVTNPNNPVPQQIAVADVFDERPTKGSMMPKGLFNYYHPPQIMDVLAYIEADGDPKHALFGK